MIRAVLFDFDGTLADSFTPITSSTNHVRQHYGLPALSETMVREYVGLGLDNLLQRLVPCANLNEAVALYREHHAIAMRTQTKLLPGVAQTLPELARRGLQLAVCSNKRVEFTRELVKILGLDVYFPVVLGPDDVHDRAKPDPAMLYEALKRLNVSAASAVYVGDMAVDVHTARAAGLPVWLVLGGAAGQESATACGPDRILSNFAELCALLPAGSE